MIYIGRGAQRLGSFSEDEIRAGLASGRFFQSDLGWKEGMTNWVPLSQFPELTAPPVPMPPLPPPVEAEPAPPVQPIGLPWDLWRQHGLAASFFATARLVLFNPAQAFTWMQTTGSVWGPLLYNIIGGWIGVIAASVYAVLITRIEGPLPAGASKWQQMTYVAPDVAKTEMKILIAFGPLIVTVIVLISSLITHLYLVVAGGANKPLSVTLRVFCFCWGSSQLLQLFPGCGSPIAMVWMGISCIIGLAAAHGTTTGRSLAAIALLAATCFACCFGSMMLAGG